MVFFAVSCTVLSVLFFSLFAYFFERDKNEPGYSILLFFACIFCIVSIALWITISDSRLNEIKTSVPPKIEMIITEKTDGVSSEKDTLYIYKFNIENICNE